MCCIFGEFIRPHSIAQHVFKSELKASLATNLFVFVSTLQILLEVREMSLVGISSKLVIYAP